MDKIINQETIENLKQLIRNRNSYLDIKEVLDNLEDLPKSPEQSEGDDLDVLSSKRMEVVQSPSPSGDAILKDLKELLHTKGRSSITEQSIKDIINKYGEEK